MHNWTPGYHGLQRGGKSMCAAPWYAHVHDSCHYPLAGCWGDGSLKQLPRHGDPHCLLLADGGSLTGRHLGTAATALQLPGCTR
jgi:hypothetical protein